MKLNIRAFSALALSILVLLPFGSRADEGTIVPGVWNSSFTSSLAYADEQSVPMIFFVGAEDCSSCEEVSELLAEDSRFLDWKNAHSEFVYCYLKGKSKNNIAVYLKNKKRYSSAVTEEMANALAFTTGSIIPRVAFYWPGHAPEKQTFSCWNGYMPIKDPEKDTIGQLLACLNEFFADYKAKTAFIPGGTTADRLEVYTSATTLTVPVKRTSGLARTKPTFVVVPSTATTNEISWTSGQEEAFVKVDLPSDLTVGETVELVLLGEDKEEQAKTSCWVVDEVANSPKNPRWIGERDAATLAAGEWTMDVDLALSRAATAKSVSLTMVGGSLWCPDCVNADAYLVDTDVFKEWATNANIFCAALDVPSFPKGGKTCLLTYTPTSVSDRYVNATTPPQERVQSGAGYLSRKGVPQTSDDGASATAILARNLNLVTNSVAVGGLCRPECLSDSNTKTYQWKTGVPCFILRNAEGRIIGRLDQFSNVSPTSDDACAAYVQRLNELVGLADDPTEELNAHWSTATTSDCELSIRNGTNTSTISAIDLVDYWKLSGRDTWTRTTFTVKGAASTSSAAENDVRLSLWKVANGKETKIAAQEGNLATGVSLASQEIASDAEVAYFISLEALETSAAFALDRASDSVASYTLTATSADDVGVLAFEKTSAKATETDAKKAGGTLRVYVPVVRTGGASGATNAAVVVSQDSTAFADRYQIVTDTVAWADGETGTKNVIVDVFDDGNADGTQTLILLFGEAAFTLQIVDNDKMNVGKISLADAVPAVAKKGTVLAEEGSIVQLGIARTDGASGDASCTVSATAGTFLVGDESIAAPVVTWASRSSGTQWINFKVPTLDECSAGKVTVTLANVTGAKVLTSAKSLTIQLVGKNAPRFEVQEKAFDLVRYCTFSETIGILNLAECGTVKIAKLSGSIPSGVSVKIANGELIVSGTPTVKNASCEAVYQVTQVVGRQTVQGQTIRLSFKVTDVSTLDAGTPGANPSIKTTQKIPDIPVIDETDEKAKRLAGIVSGLTIMSTGKATAKYKCADGTISLSSKNWSAYDAKTGALTTTLVAARSDHAIEATVAADGTVEVALTDPAFEGDLVGKAPRVWSKTEPATDWVGYCTAAISGLPEDAEVLTGGAIPLVLKMTSSAAKTGTMNYSGTLPNGQTFSGSAVLVRDGIDAVLLPIYYRTTKDFFTALLRIEAKGVAKAISADADVVPQWKHTETLEAACLDVTYSTVVGSWIDSNLNLLETLDQTKTSHVLAAPGALDEGIGVTFAARSISLIAAEAKSVNAKLSFSRTTGLITGSFKMVTESGKTVTANYRAVMLPDWGDGCPTCGDIPWAMGAFWYSDKMSGVVNGRTKTYTVKFGDTLYIEAE